MNRLLTANGPCADFATRATSLVTVKRLTFVTLFALTTSVSAQLPLPPGTTASPHQGMTSAEQLIPQVRSAMTRRDYTRSVELFRHAAALGAQTPQLASQIETLRSELIASGIDRDLLALPPTGPLPTLPSTTMQRLPLVSGAQPIGGASAAARPDDLKREALRLIAIGRAALDRGDASTAVALARQAQSLGVAEKDFAAGEPRVWQLLLDAESAARRSGIALTSGTNTGSVQQAFGTIDPNAPGGVAQTVFNPGAMENGGLGSQVMQVQNQTPTPLPASPTSSTYAADIYREGLQALSDGNQQLARDKFSEAWKYESTLDLDTRRQLKDKLTLLQPSRLGSAMSSESDKPMTAIDKAALENQEKTRRLYREVTAELAAASGQHESAPLDALDQLETLRRRVEGSDVDDAAKRSLASMVTKALSDQKQYVEANRAQINLDLQNESVRTDLATEAQQEARIDDEIANLVQNFNELIDARRFNEAEIIAKQVQELKPGSPIAITMFHNARMQVRGLMDQEIRDEKEDIFLNQMLGVERAAIGLHPDRDFEFGDVKGWADLSRRRTAGTDADTELSVREKEIKQALSTDVNVKYNNRPIHEVLEDLSAMTGVPIVMDNRALSAVRVTVDTPVNLSLQKSIPLKSALSIILGELELTYMIDNDVLNITSVEATRSKVFPRTYRVTDLVTPIPNFVASYDDGMAGALRAAYQMTNPQTDVHIMPVSAMDLGSGMSRNASPGSMNPNMLGQYNPMGVSNGFGGNPSPLGGGQGGNSMADFQSLMQLIQETVEPTIWQDLGGTSTMAPYPQNLSLVISTTSEVHDKIEALLTTLRRLQNLQITIEVRFITLSDTFFEQIGVDFDVQFDDHAKALPTDDGGPDVTIGFNGLSGLPTADLDIQFDNNSFGATPPFSNADAGSFSTLGFAILSDIEAFFFLQAAQGDNRNNVMQAPKVTLFDGQIATIQDQTQRPFVTSITPVVGDFAVAQQPVIMVLNEGTQLSVQGVVSDDKRFVRLTLVPFFSQIGDVDTFTFEGRRSTSSSSREQNEDTNGDGVVDDKDSISEDASSEFVSGTTVQLPTFAFTSVSTTVSVPDGGTILLGGIKRLSEGRSERGVPFLSKIPYVSRLFRNVATGRDARSLMLMVTPRIIIQEEEEIAQTGYDPTR
ncbi:type II secretion system protein GspD [Novipirellula artificiosorum]|uniref:Type IV pilus biogenesis and competence protein PilQ n=1 Tax=Novipirellula artificiosorum TaxID=2528016 RepID=A0A5C6DHF6_9BACT|nr:general secretion pathway protein GspD [Novipirellula artificiosorum]TWU34389.1 Type IV pilus biogenesis and competence protein PilQ precursor [Novipirellula artificiosorum]